MFFITWVKSTKIHFFYCQENIMSTLLDTHLFFLSSSDTSSFRFVIQRGVVCASDQVSELREA